ncbi:hypothetical protein K1719_036742 [Acacia pycnantha]|nr:hypothetical protein K1719_036742 [Acacia pycnantha]
MQILLCVPWGRGSLENCLNFISFGYAAQSLLAALGSVQFVSNIAFAYFVLNKMVTVKVLVATAFIVLGNIFLVAFGNHQSPVLGTKPPIENEKAGDSRNQNNQDALNSILSRFRDLNFDENLESLAEDQKDEMTSAILHHINNLEKGTGAKRLGSSEGNASCKKAKQ